MTSVVPKRSPFSNELSVLALIRFLPLNTLLWGGNRQSWHTPRRKCAKLLSIAKIAFEEFDSDLRSVLKKPLPQAKKALKRFPSIGDPGAEKILLFTRSYPVMALDSNGLRVLCRVGFAEEQKNYPATYRLVLDAIHGQLPKDYDSLIRAHQLLRQHGQELCKRSKPHCADCPLSDSCNYCQKV